MTTPSADVEPVSGKCVQCDACSQVVIETVPGRGQGWKCPECGWWYWLQEPKKVTHAKAELDRLEALEKEATKGPWAEGMEDGREAYVFTLDTPDADYVAALRNAAPALIAVARAAERYRAIGQADPTSLDLPPAGSDLDRAIALLIEGGTK